MGKGIADKCYDCGGIVDVERARYQYQESGLDNIYLEDVEINYCPACKTTTAPIYAILELTRAIASALDAKGDGASDAERKFLDKAKRYLLREILTEPSVIWKARMDNGNVICSRVGVDREKTLQMRRRARAERSERIRAMTDREILEELLQKLT